MGLLLLSLWRVPGNWCNRVTGARLGKTALAISTSPAMKPAMYKSRRYSPRRWEQNYHEYQYPINRTSSEIIHTISSRNTTTAGFDPQIIAHLRYQFFLDQRRPYLTYLSRWRGVLSRPWRSRGAKTQHTTVSPSTAIESCASSGPPTTLATGGVEPHPECPPPCMV